MMHVHTLQRGLIAVLVILAGTTVVLIGPAGAESIEPATVTVSADEVADEGVVVSGTAAIPVSQFGDDDTLTLETRGVNWHSGAESFNLTAVNCPDCQDVTIDHGAATNGWDIITLQNPGNSEVIDLEISIELSEDLADDAGSYNDWHLVEIVENGDDVAHVFELTIESGQFGSADLQLDNPEASDGVYEASLTDDLRLTLSNFQDAHGNELLMSEVSGDVDITFENLADAVTQSKTITTSAGDLVWGYSITGTAIEDWLHIGRFDITVSANGLEIADSKLRVYPPRNASISAETEHFYAGNATTLSVDLGADRADIGYIPLHMTATGDGEFDLTTSNDTNDISFNFETTNSTSESTNISGGATGLGYYPEIGVDGVWNTTIHGATPGTYTLAVDVMPSVQSNAGTTRDTVTVRVYGPPTAAEGACDRPFVGTIYDPDPLAVQIVSLTDATERNITGSDVRIEAITIANQTVHSVDEPASAVPLSVADIDPTRLPTSVSPGEAAVAARVAWTANGTARTRSIPLDTVELVHEATAPPTAEGNWAPVTAPMPYERVVYEGARTGADGRPLEVRWHADDGYTPFDTAAGADRQPLAHSWYVANATRVGFVYAREDVPDRTRQLPPGWHHLGPGLDLTERATQSLDVVMPGEAANRSAYYDGSPVVAPEDITVGPYDSYWVLLNETAEYPLPGANYEPGDRIRVGGEEP